MNCEIIKDLLPLYLDGICSDESRKMVDEHLLECEECRNYYSLLKKNEIGEAIELDKDSVVKYQTRKFKRKSFVVGSVFAGIFMIPVLICFIVNLAAGAALDWFFIVLTSLMVAASLIIVPLMVPKYKFNFTLLSFALTLVLLLLTCNIYSDGNFFNVAASASIFGLAVVCLPIAVNCKPLKEKLGNHKMLTVLGADTFLYAVMMFAIGASAKAPGFAKMAIGLSVPFVGFIWVVLLVLRYLPGRKIMRIGVVSILTGGFIFAVNNMVNSLLGVKVAWPEFEPLVWNYSSVEGNIKWLCMLAGLVIGLIFIIIGILGGKRHEKNN